MHTLYREVRGSEKKVSYEYYRRVFESDFNISFGYPRSDTCSACEKYQAEIKVSNKSIEEGGNKDEINVILRKKQIENQVHLKKANEFYARKRKSQKRSMTKCEEESITMDYQKNLSLPNLATNDIYYFHFSCSMSIHYLLAIIYFTVTLRQKQAKEVMRLHQCCTTLHL